MKKWPFFAIILPWMASYGSETSFLLIFSARDDLVKVSWKSDARKCQNQVTLLTLTGWVKGTSPFSNCQTHKNLGRVRTTRMNAVMAREQSKEADHSSAPCKPALGHCQIEARHKRMKKEGRKYSNLLALKVLLDSLWPMITIPIPSIPSLPTHKASLII